MLFVDHAMKEGFVHSRPQGNAYQAITAFEAVSFVGFGGHL